MAYGGGTCSDLLDTSGHLQRATAVINLGVRNHPKTGSKNVIKYVQILMNKQQAF